MTNEYVNDTSVRNNLQKFYEPIPMPGGYYFDQVERLKANERLYNSQFKDGKKYDKQGYRKFFIQEIKPTCDVASKFVDLDTKDLTVIPTGEGQEFKVYILQKRLKQWLRNQYAPNLMNEITQQYPKGHVVIKKTKGNWSLVNILNLRMDTSAQYLKKSQFVYELVRMSKGEVTGMGWNTEELFKRQDYGTYDIYDCYHKIGNNKWKREIKASLFCSAEGGKYKNSTESYINDRNDYLPSLVLFEEEVDKLPYRELKWEDVPGRWLGLGFIELNEDNQIAINEAEALERKGLIFKATQMWQTRDESIGGSNALTTENGFIYKVQSEVTPIQKDNQDLAAFNATRSRHSDNIMKKTFTYPAGTGENLPSRTPLGAANLQASMIASYFDLKRENLGIFYRDWIVDDVIPDFQKENFDEHSVTFLDTDDDIDEFREMLVNAMVGDVKVKYAIETGFFPSQVQIEDAKQRILNDLRTKKSLIAKVIDGWYKDAKFIVDINTTGEQLDISSLSQTIQLGLQMLGTNPALLTNPASRAMFFILMGLGGVSPVSIKAMKSVPMANAGNEPLPTGGSVSAPTSPTLQPVQQ